jgi:hypothetical protein
MPKPANRFLIWRLSTLLKKIPARSGGRSARLPGAVASFKNYAIKSNSDLELVIRRAGSQRSAQRPG